MNGVSADPVRAVAFGAALPDGRASGTLAIEGGLVVFRPEADGAELRLPLARLRPRLGGTARTVLFLEAEDRSIVLSTEDPGLLAHPSLAADPRLTAELGRSRSRHRRALAVVGALAALPVIALVLLVVFWGALVDRVVALVPAELERTLGDAVWDSMRGDLDVVDDAEANAALEALAAPLLAASEGEGLDVRLFLVRAPEPNAFALPGGVVALHTGLVDVAGDGAEVLGVLAHEVAHVAERHSLRQLVQSLGVFAVVQALVGDLGGLVGVAAEGGTRLATLEFSRDHEREADAVGWEILVRAGIDPRGLVRFFERLRELEAERGVGPEGGLSFLSTHPATEERIRVLRERAEAEAPDLPSTSGREHGLERLRDALESIPAEGVPGSEQAPDGGGDRPGAGDRE